jgi:hypothetical protein
MVKSAEKLIGKKIIVVGGTSGCVTMLATLSKPKQTQNWIRSRAGIH